MKDFIMKQIMSVTEYLIAIYFISIQIIAQW